MYREKPERNEVVELQGLGFVYHAHATLAQRFEDAVMRHRAANHALSLSSR